MLASVFALIAVAPFILVLHRQPRPALGGLLVAAAFGLIVIAFLSFLSYGMAKGGMGSAGGGTLLLVPLCLALAGQAVWLAYKLARSEPKWLAAGLAALLWAVFWGLTAFQSW